MNFQESDNEEVSTVAVEAERHIHEIQCLFLSLYYADASWQATAHHARCINQLASILSKIIQSSEDTKPLLDASEFSKRFKESDNKEISTVAVEAKRNLGN